MKQDLTLRNAVWRGLAIIITGLFCHTILAQTCDPGEPVPAPPSRWHWKWEPAIGAEAALGTSGLDWFTTTGARWTPDAGNAFDTAPSMRSAPIRHNEATGLKTTVTGPGVLAFQWKTSSEGDYDQLVFCVKGAVRNSISGETDWERVHVTLDEGTHNVEWFYWKDYSVNSGEDCGWLDAVEWTPLAWEPAVGAEAALGTSGLDWFTTTGSCWVPDEENAFDTAPSMRSMEDGEIRISMLKTTVTGPGVLKFQ